MVPVHLLIMILNGMIVKISVLFYLLVPLARELVRLNSFADNAKKLTESRAIKWTKLLKTLSEEPFTYRSEFLNLIE
jgi:hypothetical protein